MLNVMELKLNKQKNHRLPSLNILRVFESAARHLSFKKAAEELCITPPAVSHQIRTLEEQLGLVLFTRLNRSLILSSAGEQYFSQVQFALQQLQSATNELVNNNTKSTFVINTVPMLVSTLLAPHIHSFQESQLNFNIQIDSDASRTDFAISELDVAIRRVKGDEPNLVYRPIFKIAIAPVCSPHYLAKNPQANLQTLENCRLIRTSIDMGNWPLWLKQWGYQAPTTNELLLNSFRSVLDATQSGAGIAMGYLPIISSLIKRGDLITPFGDKTTFYGEPCLVYRKKDQDKPIVQAFELWLTELLIELGWSDK
jgi:LysR family transcriptional regulator, glycine cleavage system transcriptional activator